jgi:hypothetical protein
LVFNGDMKFLAASLALLALSSSSSDSTRLVDLDGDGRLDLVRLAHGVLRVDWNLGNRTLQSAELELPAAPVASFLVEDLNADGRLDLYVTTTAANVALVSDGARGFVDATAALGLLDGGVGLGVRQVDLDGDGVADLLLRNVAGDVVFWGRRGGGFERDESLSTPPTTSSGGGATQSAAAPPWAITPGSLPPPLPGPFAPALGTHLPPGSLILWEGATPPMGFETTGWSLKVDPPVVWRPELAMPTARGRAVAGALDGRIFVMGGFTGTSFTDAVEAYGSPPSWKTGVMMPAPLADARSAVVAERMYVFGGLTPGGLTDDVNVYDPATGWAPGSPVPSQQSAPGCAAVGDKIYLIGGGTVSGVLDLVREYDTIGDSWKTRPSLLPTARSGIAAAELGGKIYLIGGSALGGPVDLVDVYDPATNAFSPATPLPTPSFGGSAVAFDGRLFYFPGGATVLSYDPGTGLWTQELSPTGSYFEGTAVVYQNEIHLVGGDGGGGMYHGDHEAYDLGGPRLHVVRKN